MNMPISDLVYERLKLQVQSNNKDDMNNRKRSTNT